MAGCIVSVEKTLPVLLNPNNNVPIIFFNEEDYLKHKKM